MKITSFAAASLIQSCLLLKNIYIYIYIYIYIQLVIYIYIYIYIYIAVGIDKNNDFGSTTQYNMN